MECITLPALFWIVVYNIYRIFNFDRIFSNDYAEIKYMYYKVEGEYTISSTEANIKYKMYLTLDYSFDYSDIIIFFKASYTSLSNRE